MTKEEWNEWKGDHRTQEFFRVLSGIPQFYMDQWAEGSYLSDDPQATQNTNQRMFGHLDALREVAAVDYSAFKGWAYHHQDKEQHHED